MAHPRRRHAPQLAVAAVRAGTFSPNQRDAIKDAFIARATKIGEGRYTEAAGKAYASLFPDKTDIGEKTRAVKRQAGIDLFDGVAGTTPTLTRYGIRNEPVSGQAPAKQTNKSTQEKPADGTRFILEDGRHGVWQGGKRYATPNKK